MTNIEEEEEDDDDDDEDTSFFVAPSGEDRTPVSYCSAEAPPSDQGQVARSRERALLVLLFCASADVDHHQAADLTDVGRRRLSGLTGSTRHANFQKRRAISSLQHSSSSLPTQKVPFFLPRTPTNAKMAVITRILALALALVALVANANAKTVTLKWTKGKLSASGGRLDHKNRALYVRRRLSNGSMISVERRHPLPVPSSTRPCSRGNGDFGQMASSFARDRPIGAVMDVPASARTPQLDSQSHPSTSTFPLTTTGQLR